MLDLLGQAVGEGPTELVSPFLAEVASQRTLGGWVVIGSALREQLARDLVAPMGQCREYIVAADAWYATDILGERVPGPALVVHFSRTLALLKPWRVDGNPWVRRAAGVAVHHWAKRARGAPDTFARAGRLVHFLDPMFEDEAVESIKGVGWGLKTLGKTYPELVTRWLEEQLIVRGRKPRALMLRKAVTYLPPGLRSRLEAE
jgi:3-methyladenine DNA glycosylase AlkD